MVSAVKGKSEMVTKEDFDRRIESVGESRCREEGGEYVHGHRRDDGIYVHGFCRMKGSKRTYDRYVDRNGNTRAKWKRHSDSRETEYILSSEGKEGVVKSHDGYSVWWIEENGKREEGRTKNVREAKYEVERRLRD